jgi:hypothetical protein
MHETIAKTSLCFAAGSDAAWNKTAAHNSWRRSALFPPLKTCQHKHARVVRARALNTVVYTLQQRTSAAATSSERSRNSSQTNNTNSRCRPLWCQQAQGDQHGTSTLDPSLTTCGQGLSVSTHTCTARKSCSHTQDSSQQQRMTHRLLHSMTPKRQAAAAAAPCG